MEKIAISHNDDSRNHPDHAMPIDHPRQVPPKELVHEGILKPNVMVFRRKKQDKGKVPQKELMKQEQRSKGINQPFGTNGRFPKGKQSVIRSSSHSSILDAIEGSVVF